jgi:hypothetical protein
VCAVDGLTVAATAFTTIFDLIPVFFPLFAPCEGAPTLILFKKREPIVRITGYQPEDRIVKQIEPALV